MGILGFHVQTLIPQNQLRSCPDQHKEFTKNRKQEWEVSRDKMLKEKNHELFELATFHCGASNTCPAEMLPCLHSVHPETIGSPAA